MGMAVEVDFDMMAQKDESAQASKEEAEVVTADLKQEVMLGTADSVEVTEDTKEDK